MFSSQNIDARLQKVVDVAEVSKDRLRYFDDLQSEHGSKLTLMYVGP